jgi:glutamate synthase domain-containing protein 3
MAEIVCGDRPVREINREIRRLLSDSDQNITVRNPRARHNLAVALLQPCHILFDGSVGYYCAGLIDGPVIEVKGSAGWGLGESMLSGQVIVHGNAGNGAGAAMRGGKVIIGGDAAARAGVSMKGGLLLIAGNCGYMAGFMGQKGTLIVCGDAGEAFADSMYETVCFVGGRIAELGNDAVVQPPTSEDLAFLSETMQSCLPRALQSRCPQPEKFTKVVAGRKLWNFDKRNWKIWQEAL